MWTPAGAALQTIANQQALETCLETNATKTNDATLTATHELRLTAVPAGAYIIDSRLPYDAFTSADFKSQLDVQNNTKPAVLGIALSSFTTGVFTDDAAFARIGQTLPAGGVGLGTIVICQWAGRVELTAPGDIYIQWAQNTSSGVATTLHAGAYLRATPT